MTAQEPDVVHPSTGEPVRFENSAVDGYIAKEPDFWNLLDFTRAWVDKGPSPAGNAGPYLKVPVDNRRAAASGHFGDTVHRIYRRAERKRNKRAAV